MTFTMQELLAPREPIMGWCRVCQKMEPVMQTATRRAPACVVPQPERRAR